MKTRLIILFVCVVGLLWSCGGTQPADAPPLEPAADTAPAITSTPVGPQRISPSHPMIRYTGRVDTRDPEAVSFSYPGVSIRVRYTGSELRVILDDNATTQSENNTNYFSVIVDGAKPVRMKTTPEQKEYILARKPGDGEHEVELFKRSESSHGANLNEGKVTVRGFIIDGGAEMLPPVERKLKMEFIGDSITCGYGNELSVDNPDNYHFTTLNSNAWNAWGAIAARRLDASYVAVAYSGRGVVRNYSGIEAPTIPDMYLTTLPDDPDSDQWDPARYQPDIVVINLGTNDFSIGLKPGKALDELEKQYGLRYETFLQELLGFYPGATFIIAVGPMLSDEFPKKYKALTRVRRALQKLVKSFKDTGNSNVHFLELAQQHGPFGEDYHPTVATHGRMADELIAFIESLESE
ncbi:MAG: hypothetical protein JXX14_18600 [Deltaproteobacteria bacterium]|nr:hypothetical protein [Deltaproteobacteria bacterium]